MESLDVWTIVSLVLLIASTVFAGVWLTAKKKAKQIYNLGKEALDVAKAAIDALEDNKLTPEEVQKIKDEAVEVKAAWKLLMSREE